MNVLQDVINICLVVGVIAAIVSFFRFDPGLTGNENLLVLILVNVVGRTLWAILIGVSIGYITFIAIQAFVLVLLLGVFGLMLYLRSGR